MALDSADERAVRRELTRVAPDLWAEGLALPTRAALERARRRGDPDADAAIREVEHIDTGAKIVEALVLRLAQDLRDRAHAQVAPDHSGAR